MARILGQCNTADFKSIEHLAVEIQEPLVFDLNTLSRKQKLAIMVMSAFKESGLAVRDTYYFREVIFWDDNHIDFKFHNVPGARELRMKLNDEKIQRDFATGIQNILGEER